MRRRARGFFTGTPSFGTVSVVRPGCFGSPPSPRTKVYACAIGSPNCPNQVSFCVGRSAPPLTGLVNPGRHEALDLASERRYRLDVLVDLGSTSG